MSVGGLIRSSYLLYFSQPAADRVLLKAIKARPVRSIVELGVGLGGRTERMLEVAAWRRDCLPLAYTGIDLFDSRRADQPPLTLKRAFHNLRAAAAASGVKIRLVPGDAYSALARMANALTGTDFIVISADHHGESLAQAWRFVPRMMHAQTLVFLEDTGGGPGKARWRQLTHAEVQRLAAQALKSHRRAA